ncbi:MAG: oligosaccharide flippase family protein [Bacteroidetes bacterium]|nr:oligosaccharide flippase family protein [Bacteroidota bacterium]
MQAKFIKNIFLLVIINLLVKPFGILVIEPGVQNTVGATAYGLYNALFSFTLVFNILLDVGINNFNNRTIAQQSNLLGAHFPGIVALRLVLAIVYVLVLVAAALVIGYLPAYWMLLMVLAFNQVLAAFLLFIRSNISALQFYKTDSFFSIFDRVILIAITGWMLLYRKPEFKIEWYVLAQTVAYSISLITAFIILAQHTKSIFPKWEGQFSASILRQSFPYAFLILLMILYSRVDVIMLERMLPDGALQSGIYAQAFRLLDACNMIGYLFAGLLLPMFARMIQLNEPVEQLARLSFNLIMVPALTIIVISFFFSKEIMDTLYIAHTDESSAILGLVMIGFGCFASNYIFGTLLTAKGDLSLLNKTAISGVCINIALNIVLIPSYKVNGAAIASAITQVVMSVLQLLIAHRQFKFNYNWNQFARILAFVICLIAATWLFTQVSTGWIIKVTGTVCVSLLLAMMLQLINLTALKNLLLSKE